MLPPLPLYKVNTSKLHTITPSFFCPFPVFGRPFLGPSKVVQLLDKLAPLPPLPPDPHGS
jgi:hypothetical protein